jgi:predicted transcriptional regulator
MNSKSPLFDRIDPAVEADADQKSEADVRAGRLISHNSVTRWLASWAAGKPLPRPKVGE